jgi:hypothetical protein
MSESALCRAVRDQIRLHADFSTKTRTVQCEMEEAIPATAGDDVYVLVTYGGVTAGPVQDTADGIIDELFGVDVTIALRAPLKPRDRGRDLWIATSKSFETYERAIRTQIDKQVAVITAANVFIAAEEAGSPVGFGTYLRWSATSRIRRVNSLLYDGSDGEGREAYVRTIEFRGAERCRVIGS